MLLSPLTRCLTELHLLEYHQTHLEYLRKLKQRGASIQGCPVQEFSHPNDSEGYGDNPISSDLITDVIKVYSGRTREEESAEYIRSLTGIETHHRSQQT